MQLDLDLIFPIRDVPSAELMTLKAVCLWNAGVIDARQRKLVEQRAQQFLEKNTLSGRDGSSGNASTTHSGLRSPFMLAHDPCACLCVGYGMMVVYRQSEVS